MYLFQSMYGKHSFFLNESECLDAKRKQDRFTNPTGRTSVKIVLEIGHRENGMYWNPKQQNGATKTSETKPPKRPKRAERNKITKTMETYDPVKLSVTRTKLGTSRLLQTYKRRKTT